MSNPKLLVLASAGQRNDFPTGKNGSEICVMIIKAKHKFFSATSDAKIQKRQYLLP